MITEPKLPTLTAVVCVQCSHLHDIEATSYLIIYGQITRRRSSQGRIHNQSQQLGTTERPIVLCDNNSCLVMHLQARDS